MWEGGPQQWRITCSRREHRCLFLRGVPDLSFPAGLVEVEGSFVQLSSKVKPGCSDFFGFAPRL